MEYLFSAEVPLLPDGEIFKGTNAGGYVEGGVLHIYDRDYHYTYTNGVWNEKGYSCGKGRVPVLNIENLTVLDEEGFRSIQYVEQDPELKKR